MGSKQISQQVLKSNIFAYINFTKTLPHRNLANLKSNGTIKNTCSKIFITTHSRNVTIHFQNSFRIR